MKISKIYILLAILFLSATAYSQLSPGDLSKYHEHLEGLSNCTQCHDIGKKVSDQKCLDCHQELDVRIKTNKGYHSSKEVKEKSCIKCHSDHHGKNFEIIRFDTLKFEHEITGYTLEGKHREKSCADCHQSNFIKDEKIRKKKFTYLGLENACSSCHEDYHQGTLKNTCADCHDSNAFRPAPLFDHNQSNYPLKGKHSEVDCAECHEVTQKNGVEFQAFSNLSYQSCADCHQDPHDNKFGQNCSKCHQETSFHQVKKINDFNHNQTDFPLIGKHQGVSCKSCHPGRYSEPIKHGNCFNCHEDYHQGDFILKKDNKDCNTCHDEHSFQRSNYGLSEHEKSNFPLTGAHEATPCIACHLTTERWKFRDLGSSCSDCHNDIHDPYMEAKYYPEKNCMVCHETAIWNKVEFDHELTGYPLEGKHAEVGCRECHFTETEKLTTQQFSSLSDACLQCHEDEHQGQFIEKGGTGCLQCHDYHSWEASGFDHDQTNFPLDGEHKKVDCIKCHLEKEDEGQQYIEYKIKDYRCETCH